MVAPESQESTPASKRQESNLVYYYSGQTVTLGFLLVIRRRGFVVDFVEAESAP